MPPKRGRGRGRGQDSGRPAAGDEFPALGGSSHRRPAAEPYRPPHSRGGGERPSHGSAEGHGATFQQPEGRQRQQETVVPESVLEDVMKLSLEPAKRPDAKKMLNRPGYGQSGRKIQLVANYFQLKFKNINIYHYDVEILFSGTKRKDESGAAAARKKKDEDDGSTIEGLKKGSSLMKQGRTAKEAAVGQKETHTEHQQKRAPGKNRCRTVIAKLLTMDPFRKYFPVYDGQKNLYTSKELPVKNKQKFTVSLDEDNRVCEFEVQIQPVIKPTGNNIINLEPLNEVLSGRSKEVPHEVIMAFDTVLGHRVQPFTQVQVGRSFFMLNQKPVSLGEGVEIWFGYSQSVRLTERGPAVIVNFSAKAFHKAGPMIDYISDILRTDVTRLNELQQWQLKAIKEALHKVQVQVTHLRYPRRYYIKGLSSLPADKLCFEIDKRKVTVTEYFKTKYNVRLRYGYLPCLHMQSTNNTFIPMEVCEVRPNQPVLGKLSGQLTAKMIRETAIPPAQRFENISKEMNNLSNVSSKGMNEFGLQLEFRPMNFQGRVLNAPALAYMGDKESQQRGAAPNEKGVWNMEGKQFLRSRPKCSWMIVDFAGVHPKGLQDFANAFCRFARKLGMSIENVREIRKIERRETVQQALKYVKNQDVTFAVVVLSDRGKDTLYDDIKFVGDIELRLITQCIKDKSVMKFNDPRQQAQMAMNVLLKVNSKLGGTSHTLMHKPRFFDRPAMILGADAIHSPRGFRCPSIASVVGSLDAYPSQYAVTCRVQYNPDGKKISQEIITDLKDMVKSVLLAFQRKTGGKYPERIIYFRDGVSEGQFQTVLENEVPMIQHACNEALNGNIPPLTCIVVQKRHQTRLRPQNPREGVGRMGNVPPGTTVDTDITHPVFFDFFICSHEGIQGTSKPAHYTVLFDENKFSADDLQNFCHHLCHMYAKCNRSISIPPPVMYADLACTRAKKYAEKYLRDDTQSVSSVSSGEQKLPDHIERAINNTMSEIGNGMFYI